MKAWILAAVVAGALVLVGVPTVALAVASQGSDKSSAGSHPRHHHGMRPGPGHGFEKHGWGPHGFHHGDGRHFKMHKLTAKQRDALADRLDQRASQLRKAATCLRQDSDAAKCFKRFFSPPQQRG